MSEQGNQPEESDVIKLARVQGEIARMLAEELKKMRGSLDKNTQALDELRKIRLGLDQNRQTLEEIRGILGSMNANIYNVGRRG